MNIYLLRDRRRTLFFVLIVYLYCFDWLQWWCLPMNRYVDLFYWFQNRLVRGEGRKSEHDFEFQDLAWEGHFVVASSFLLVRATVLIIAHFWWWQMIVNTLLFLRSMGYFNSKQKTSSSDLLQLFDMPSASVFWHWMVAWHSPRFAMDYSWGCRSLWL